jgi:midasin (ATPase involved in ribosome maturation)
MGDTSHGLGTVARIAAGILIALAALPVVFTLLESRKPEFGTPALALTLRTWSVVTHVAAGVLIVGTAVSEIWLNLDSVGQWLFGVYGAAAAVALLGIAGFYLSFVAESPPPPPKPLKPKKEKKPRRGRGKKGDDADEAADADEDSEETADADEDTADTDAADESPEVETTAAEPGSTAEEAPAVEESEDTQEAESGGLRNRRPSGKVSHRRRRSRRGVAIDE